MSSCTPSSASVLGNALAWHSSFVAKTYPQGFAVKVPAKDWMSQQEAAETLNVGVLAVGSLVTRGHLQPAECVERTYGLATGPSLEPGVTRASVNREMMWRNSAALWQRSWRRVKDTLNWF